MANVDEVLNAAARISFAAGEHGTFRGIDTLLAKLVQIPRPQPQAWALALRVMRWSFDPESAPTPQPDEAARFIKESQEVREVAARACAVMQRVWIRAFDTKRLAQWIETHAALNGFATTKGKGADVEDTGPRDVGLWSARLWQRFLAGDTSGEEGDAKALFDEASRQRAAPQVIESAVLRALLALSAGSTDEAVELARRASRMAQSEALPQLEYLANVTLARVRRYSGRPHLALHILAALGRVAPPAWSGWIGWETLLGGGEVTRKDNPESALHGAPAMVAERSLAALITAARGGDRAVFDDAAATLESAAGVWPDLAREVQALLAALDPMRETIPDFARPWSRGETAIIPCGLHGIGIPQGAGSETEGATAFVLAKPGAEGRRFLRPGLTFAQSARLLARDSAKTTAGGVRTETGIAALALAGEPGTTREVFFRSVYGFPFVAHRHQAVLDVLCHRMRTLLGDAGEVRRDSGDAAAAADPHAASGPSLSLVLRRPVVVPDMRCALPTADRVLRALATLGTTSASSAADSLRMPLRTVQAVLQQLVAEGACSIERDGRRVAYKIEDTTFTEITSA
ncbi:MAG: helix-turn-helix transcriptional regulator [Bacteroidota bacterium]